MLISTLFAATLTVSLQIAPAQAGDMAVAQATQLPAAEAPAVAEEPEEDRMICRTETVVGSRMPQRVCMTQRHREDRTRDSRALAQRLDVQNSNRDRIYAPGAGRGE